MTSAFGIESRIAGGGNLLLSPRTNDCTSITMGLALQCTMYLFQDCLGPIRAAPDPRVSLPSPHLAGYASAGRIKRLPLSPKIAAAHDAGAARVRPLSALARLSAI